MGEEMKEFETGSHFTGEYARLGVSVNDNFGLSQPVIVNALTGVMHIGKLTTSAIPMCQSDKIPENIPHDEHAVIKSLSCVHYRACRLCEKKLKKCF